VYETPEVAWFDGVHAVSTATGDFDFQVGGYLGAATHFYESSPSGDLVAGAHLQLRPVAASRLRLDFMRLEDDTRLLNHGNGLFGASYWHDFGSTVQFEAQYSRLDNRDRDARGRLSYSLPESDLHLQVTYYGLLLTQGDLALEADPFFNQLNELRPYDQFGVLLSQGVGDKLQLQGAADLRRVRDRADIGFYNRDFDHYYAKAILADFDMKGLTLSGTLDFWDSDSQLMRSWGGDLSYEVDANTFSIGTYYSLFKYDLFLNSERDHVRTFYFKLRHKASEALTLDCDYEFEDEDDADYHRFRMGVSWRF
ncbi:MAG: hypothetical protein KDC98_01965, partial [Planctomycetes bacterium]|nr:hypothetical protein [Planctomycetota bacterium]